MRAIYRWAAGMLLAAAGAAVAQPEMSPSSLDNGRAVDAEPLGRRIPVVLVHGFGGSTEGWDNFLRAYEQNPAWQSAFKPYSFRYSSTTAEVLSDPAAPRTISALGGALRDAMQSYYDKSESAPAYGFGNRPVIVLAHSMGGLVARSMMQEHTFRDGQPGGQKVVHLITLGTPHHGSPLADAGLVLGIQTVSELSDTYLGFVVDMTWTNYDALDRSSLRCNPWLAQLNQYAPAGGAQHGRCGWVPANSQPGYYERIIAYGAGSLQERDVDLGQLGVIKPGSASSLFFSHSYLRSGLSKAYANDGIVPLISAQFEGPSLWRRAEAFACDHRYIRRGYPEFVRTSISTYTDWAFCAAAPNGVTYPSGGAGGYAITGSIFGAQGGVVDTIRQAGDAQRVFTWAEQAHGAFLQPSGMTTGVGRDYYFRYYGATNSYLAVQAGNVYYLGPASGQRVLNIGTVADLLGAAERAGL